VLLDKFTTHYKEEDSSLRPVEIHATSIYYRSLNCTSIGRVPVVTEITIA